MAAHQIQAGQIWLKIDTGQTFLVTKLYHEAFSTIAVLRPTEAVTESMLRVRVEHQGDSQSLPGFAMTQEE